MMRLRALLASLVAIPLLLLALTMLVSTRRLEESALRKELEARGQDITAGLAQNVGAAARGEIPSERYQAFFGQLTSIRSFASQVVYIRVASRLEGLAYAWENGELADLTRGDNVRVRRLPVIDAATQRPVVGPDGKPKTEEEVELLRVLPVRARLRGPDHSSLGTLELGLSLVPFQARLADLVRRQVEVAAVVLLLAGAFAIAFAHRLSRPLERLEGAVEEIAAGRDPEAVPEEGSRETRRLTHAFNRMSRELQEKRRMELELQAARQLQERLFPRRHIRTARCRALLESRPALEVGGDFFTEVRTPSSASPWLELALGDVSGKGMGAALLAATTHGLLCSFHDEASGARPDLVSQMTEANRVLRGEARRDARGRDFIALLLVALDTETGEGSFVNAGQVPPLIVGAAGLRVAGERLRGDPPLGILRSVRYHAGSFRLERGELLLLVSDGIVEAMNPAREVLGIEGLVAAAGQLGTGSLEERQRSLFDLIERHAAGAAQHDDATVILLDRVA